MEYDNLRVCRICGDRETLGEICGACREQAMIDNYDFEGWPELCPFCKAEGVKFEGEYTEYWECSNCGHKWEVR